MAYIIGVSHLKQRRSPVCLASVRECESKPVCPTRDLGSTISPNSTTSRHNYCNSKSFCLSPVIMSWLKIVIFTKKITSYWLILWKNAHRASCFLINSTKLNLAGAPLRTVSFGAYSASQTPSWRYVKGWGRVPQAKSSPLTAPSPFCNSNHCWALVSSRLFSGD